MLTALSKKLRNTANKLIMLAAYERPGRQARYLRALLSFHPMLKALLLYQGGFIHDAKQLTDRYTFHNANMDRVTARINAIDQALNDWSAFAEQVLSSLPINPHPGAATNKDENLTVLMVVNSCATFDHNGYAVRSSQLASALQDAGMSTCFCTRLGYPWDMLDRDSVPVQPRIESQEGRVFLKHDPYWRVGEADPVYWQAYARHLLEVIDQLTPTPRVLHAHSKYTNGIAAALAGRSLGLPVIYEMRGLWHLTRAQREPSFLQSDFFHYEERMELWAAELADAVVVISSTLKNWLTERGVAEEKVTVIPNAVSLPPPALVNREQPDDACLKLAFMGSLTPYEGLETVIEAIAQLKLQHLMVTLDIFGDGQQRDTLQQLARRYRVADRVLFHGRVAKSEIEKRLPEFDVFPMVRVESDVTRLIPPLKHLEAMLAGKTVLISLLPALLQNCPDVVSEHAVPPNDVAALAGKLRHFSENRWLLKEIGKASSDWVVKHRNWQQNAKDYKALYDQLIDKKCGLNDANKTWRLGTEKLPGTNPSSNPNDTSAGLR